MKHKTIRLRKLSNGTWTKTIDGMKGVTVLKISDQWVKEWSVSSKIIGETMVVENLETT